MKFRKKPVVIEAFQWQPGMVLPSYFAEAQYAIGEGGKVLFINTLEGTMTAQPGDWVIQGVKGELYPCKPDIFEATYEAAE